MRKSYLFSSISGLAGALLCAGSAAAQSAPALPLASGAAQAGVVGEVVVTGSRIVRNGFTAPIPTTVMSQDDIHLTALPNIADVVNQLPQLQNSATPSTTNSAISVGQGGQNIFNLRGLGSQRTLVLLDGRRVVPTTGAGTTDGNNLPSQLVKRVDIVTGGASAAYGSDAVAGAINFVLDKDFTGFKGAANGGISSRNDDGEKEGSLTYGGRFSGDRGHVLLSADGATSAGVPLLDRKTRSWFQGIRQIANPAFVSRTATPNVPALITVSNTNHALAAPGGLITAGPLRGTQFGPGGSVLPFVYGNPIAGQLMVGGQQEDTAEEIALVEKTERANLFGRVSYDINDDISAYAQFLGGYSRARELGSAKGRFFGNLTIQRTNPYVPASVATALAAAGATTFSYGLNSADLGLYFQDNIRNTRQGTFGLDGKLFKTWKWDAYYQYGRTTLKNQVENNLISANFTSAIDAIVGPAGTPVCRSFATNPTCVPLNIFGTGVASPAALNYIRGTSESHIELVQQVAEGSVSGEPFSTWAGPVSLVAGLGYRKEAISTPSIDALSGRDAFATANYKPTRGSYNVREGFAETVIPLAKDESWAKSLEFNGAGRVTNYSTSGTVATWKAGINYRPFQDLLLRGNRSRDIRAPGLSDLYAGGTTNQQPNGLDPKYNNGLVSPFPNANTGNPNLTPEKSDAYGFGAVYQPSWFAGFSASFDYYNIKIVDGIAPVAFQTIINDCFSGAHPEYCALVKRGPGFVGGVSVPDTIVSVTTAPVNLAAFRAKGYDIEASYRKNLADLVSGWDASFTIRTLATHVISNSQDNGVGVVHERAGENSGYGTSVSVPRWLVNTQFIYTQGPATISANWRWISSGVLENSFYDTATGPLTVDQNNIPAVSYVDLGATYKLKAAGHDLEFYARVSNLFDKSPPVIPNTNTFWQQYNGALYDGIGRYYRAGMRFQF